MISGECERPPWAQSTRAEECKRQWRSVSTRGAASTPAVMAVAAVKAGNIFESRMNTPMEWFVAPEGCTRLRSEPCVAEVREAADGSTPVVEARFHSRSLGTHRSARATPSSFREAPMPDDSNATSTFTSGSLTAVGLNCSLKPSGDSSTETLG